MGDRRFDPQYARVKNAADPRAELRKLSDEEVIAALAGASRAQDPYVANVLATEAQNRVRRSAVIARQLGEGVYATDREGRTTFLNPAGEQMLRVTLAEADRLTMHDVVHPYCVLGAGCPLIRVLKSGEMTQDDFGYFIRRDGTAAPVAYTVSPVTDEGEITGSVVLFRDAAPMRAAEEITREGEERLESILEAVAEGIMLLDSEGRITFANAAAERMLGRKRRDIVGRTFYDPVWELQTPHSRPILPADLPFRRVMESGEAVTHWEVKVRRKDGAQVFLRENWAPLESLAGGVSGIVISFEDVTEWRRSETARKQLAQMIDLASDAIIVRGLDGTITYWNHGAERVYGWSRREALGRDATALLKTSLPASDAEVRAAVLERGHWQGRVHQRHRTGRLMTLESRWTLQRDAEERPIAILQIDHDVTDQIQAETAQAFLAAIVESSADAIIGYNLDGTIASWNPAAERIYGYAAAEAVGAHVSMLALPGDGIVLDGILQRIAAGEVVNVPQGERRRKDGTHITISLTAFPIRDAQDRVIGGSAIVRDITAQAREDERFRALLESAPDALVATDASGRIALVNSQTERLFGYSRQEMLGAPVELLIPERLRGAHEAHRQVYAREPRARPMGVGLELLGRRKDGSEFPLEISLSPLRTTEGVIVSATIRDVSQRRDPPEAHDRRPPMDEAEAVARSHEADEPRGGERRAPTPEPPPPRMAASPPAEADEESTDHTWRR